MAFTPTHEQTETGTLYQLIDSSYLIGGSDVAQVLLEDEAGGQVVVSQDEFYGSRMVGSGVNRANVPRYRGIFPDE